MARGAHLEHDLGARLGGGALVSVALRHGPGLDTDDEQTGRHRQDRGDPCGAGPAGDARPADSARGPATVQGPCRPATGDSHEHPGGEQAAGDRDHARCQQGDRAGATAAVAHQLHDAGDRQHDDHALDEARPATGPARWDPAQQLRHRAVEDLAGGQRGGDDSACDGAEDGEEDRPGEQHLGAGGEHVRRGAADGQVAHDGAQRRGHQQQQEDLGQPEPSRLPRGEAAQLRQPQLGRPLLGR